MTMQNTREIQQVVKDKNLFERAKAIHKFRFAYCVEMDSFVDIEIDYTNYCKNKYIAFTRYENGNGDIYCNRAFQARLPLLMVELGKISECDIAE